MQQNPFVVPNMATSLDGIATYSLTANNVNNKI